MRRRKGRLVVVVGGGGGVGGRVAGGGQGWVGLWGRGGGLAGRGGGGVVCPVIGTSACGREGGRPGGRVRPGRRVAELWAEGAGVGELKVAVLVVLVGGGCVGGVGVFYSEIKLQFLKSLS